MDAKEIIWQLGLDELLVKRVKIVPGTASSEVPVWAWPKVP